MKKFLIFGLVASFLFSGLTALFPQEAAQAVGTRSCTPTNNVQPLPNDPDYPSPVPQFNDPDQSSSSDGNMNAYLYYSQNQSKTPSYRFDSINWRGAPTYSVSPALPAGLTLNTGTGEITGVPTTAQAETPYIIYVQGAYNYSLNGVVTASTRDFCIAWEMRLTIHASGGGGGGGNNNQQPSYTTFNVGNASFSSSGTGLSSLAPGTSFPGFSSTLGSFSNSAQIDLLNIVVGDPRNGVFYEVPGSVVNNSQNYGAWNPGGNNCGITSLTIGGVPQNASSGITCLKSTTSNTTPVQYWISIKLPSRTSGPITYDVAPGAFVVSQTGNYKFYTALISQTGSPLFRTEASQAFDSAPVNTPTAILDFNLSVGQQVANAPVPYSASGLLPNSNYDITVRSTPQIIAQGTVPAGGTVTGSATIPAGLAPGWHTITFTTTAADNTETKDVVWFKIAGDGTLLATSDVQPAELALTPAPQPDSWYFAFLILLVGIGAFLLAREINPEFMRVMTLARNEKGEWEFTKRRIRSEEY